jgi:hypothetical protein
MPYRVQKPYVIVNGQKLVSPTAVLQRMPFCDRCSELAATNASVYTELAPDKWFKWVSYPRFSCQPEALMGCERHPVTPEIRFLDERVKPFIGELPLKRWQRLKKEWPALVLAFVFGLICAPIGEIIFKFLHF